MQTRDIVVQCEHGLHLRVASAVAGVARDHQTTAVHVSCGNCRRANACSVLELLTLGAEHGAHLEIVADGPDETAVFDALDQVFTHGGGI